MFNFNYKKFDFWKVYDCIKHYYPIGIQMDAGKLYHSYPGLQELHQLIADNLQNETNFNNRWQTFLGELETAAGKKIIGTTYGNATSFSAYVLLEKVSAGNLARTKELHFYVSLLGPFYSIIGQENNDVLIEDRHYRSTSYLVVSPENEFAQTFHMLCKRIEARFEGYRFLPFAMCTNTIEGLHLECEIASGNTVFQALYNTHADVEFPNIIGDDMFKSEDWIKEDFVDDGGRWTSFPPTYNPDESP